MEGNLGPIAARLDANVRVVRGTALSPGTVNTSTQADVYVKVTPTAAGNDPFLGAAAEDFFETGFKFDATVDPTTVTGTTPASPYNLSGKRIGLVRKGRFPMIAAGAISLGDEVNSADQYGRVKTVNEVAGTKVYVIGQALTPASAANDIVEVDVAPYIKKT